MTIVTCFTKRAPKGQEKVMTDIKKGIPQITFTNEQFAKGRQAATDILEAGPGHHTEVHFQGDDLNENARSFVGGCRYVGKKHSTLKIVRRTLPDSTAVVYVINQG